MILISGCQASSEGQQLLRNTNLKIGAVVTPPFLVVSQDRDGRDVWSGLIWDFVEYMQEARNVSVTVISPMDWLWGHCYGSEDCSGVGCNNCSGMIGQVNRGEVDLAVGMFHEPVIRIFFMINFLSRVLHCIARESFPVKYQTV